VKAANLGIRKIRQVSTDNRYGQYVIQDPTSSFREPLTFREIPLTAPQSFLGLLALGKIDHKRYAPLAFLVECSRAEQHRHPAAILAEKLPSQTAAGSRTA